MCRSLGRCDIMIINVSGTKTNGEEFDCRIEDVINIFNLDNELMIVKHDSTFRKFKNSEIFCYTIFNDGYNIKKEGN